jgi:hypothetical protein
VTTDLCSWLANLTGCCTAVRSDASLRSLLLLLLLLPPPPLLLLQEAEWLENVCTSICLVTIFMSIIVGEKRGGGGTTPHHDMTQTMSAHEATPCHTESHCTTYHTTPCHTRARGNDRPQGHECSQQ